MPEPTSNIIRLPQAIIPPRATAEGQWVVPVLASIVGIGGAAWGLILYGLSALIGITATAFVAGAMVAGIVVAAWRTK